MTSDICHPLSGVCLLLNAVAYHLEAHKFISPTLTEKLLPKNTRIVYKSAAADKTRDDALPLVAYSIEQIQAVPYYPASTFTNNTGSTATTLTAALRFTVSTTNEALTSELAFEILQFCMSIHKELQANQLFISTISVGAVKRTSGNFFEAVTAVDTGLGYKVWQHAGGEGILREAGIRANLS